PSPPRTTARSAPARSPSSLSSPCFSSSSSGNSSSTPRAAASDWSWSNAAPIVSGLPCVTTAARVTSPDCVVDPPLELIWKLPLAAMHELQAELAVPLRAGQAGGYDARHLRLPAPRAPRRL